LYHLQKKPTPPAAKPDENKPEEKRVLLALVGLYLLSGIAY
jgi:hypothetical protein